MSAKQVMPDRIISAHPIRVPRPTKSGRTNSRSTGITYPMSHTSRRRSSASPRSSVIGTCVCALIKPGMTTRPRQSIVSFATHVSASGPTAVMVSPVMATPLDAWMVNSPSSVSTVAFVKSTSHSGGIL